MAGSGSQSESVSGFKLHFQLDPHKDAHVSRLASAPANDALNRLEVQGSRTGAADHHEVRLPPNKTRLVMSQMCWNPTATTADPQHDSLLRKVHEVVRPVLCEGFKGSVGQELVIEDGDPCPFHARQGAAAPTLSFKECCKAKYEERKEKGDAKGKPAYFAMVAEPMDTIDNENLSRQRQPIITSTSIRLGFHDFGRVEITVPLDFVSTIKERMDNCVLFHAVTPNDWLYLAHLFPWTRFVDLW